MTGARQPVMGGLFLASGLCFVAGVINPPLLPTWGDSVPQSVAVAAAHRTAWFTSARQATLPAGRTSLGDPDGFIRPHE
jgi:hypothetical protein